MIGAVTNAALAHLFASAGGNVVWRPGGVSGGNVYADVEAAFSAARTAGIGTRLWIDNSITPTPTIPAGSYDLTGIAAIVGANELLAPQITVADGATFTWTNYFGLILDNIGLLFAGTTTIPVEVPAGGLYVGLRDYAVISCLVSGTKPFFHNGGGGQIYMDVGYGSGLISAPTAHAALQLAAGGSSAFFGVASQGQISANAITGGDDGSITIADLSATTQPTSTASISLTQSGTSGIIPAYGFQI